MLVLVNFNFLTIAKLGQEHGVGEVIQLMEELGMEQRISRIYLIL